MIMTYYQGNPITAQLIDWKQYKLTKLSRNLNKRITGLDTETLFGYCHLITDDSGRQAITNNANECLAFLTHHRYRNANNFFYNMRFDAESVIKHLPHNLQVELYKDGRTIYDHHLIKYIPKKHFGITKSGHSHSFYDVAQFYETSLEKAANTYLGKTKADDGLDAARINLDPNYWLDNIDAIRQYCIYDSVLCRELAQHLHNTYFQKMGILPQSYISKANVSKGEVRRRCDIPAVQDMPGYVLTFALAAFGGGRFEIVRKGSVPYSADIDLVSAYPKQTRDLVDCTTGTWKRVIKADRDALMGFYHVRVNVPMMKVAPLPVRYHSGRIAYPCGQFVTYLNAREYWAYEKYIDIEILRGAEYSDPSPTYPFRNYIDWLFKFKAEATKESFEYLLVKKMLNSVFGSFYEKLEDKGRYYPGKLFNPVYASEITANTRVELFKIAIMRPQAVLGFATDGIILDQYPDISYSAQLGCWERDIEGPTSIIRSGLYKIGNRIKNRGLKSMEGLVTKYGQYQHIFDYIEQQPGLTEYEIMAHRPLSLGECIAHHNKRGTADINVFVDQAYTIDINLDRKRYWDDTFRDGADLMSRSIDSWPMVLGEI